MDQTRITELDYYDPIRKEVSVCEPSRRICTVREWPQNEAAVEACKPLERPGMTISCDALGDGSVGNLQTVGSRQIVTRSGGPLKQPEPTIKEFWFSPRLDLNLVVKRFEPRGGAQNFAFTDINLNEPDARLFTPPEGFRTARTVIQ